MADFEELMNSLQNAGEDGPGETIYDDLRASYNDRVSAGDAKVAELTASNETANAEIGRLKAHNYDLLTQVQRGNPPTVNGKLESSEAEETKTVTLDDIISYE